VKTILALVAALPFTLAHAALEGELWEVSTQMNIPGMPAGMGGQKTRVCSDKSDAKKQMQGKGSEKCKVTDYKQSGNKYTMTMECPDGTAVIENTFNAAHTEYNGTMSMKSKRGDMTMTMNGKKLGACDLQVAQQDRQDAQAAGKQMAADMAAMTAKMNADMEMNKAQGFAKLKASCDEGVTAMDSRKLALALCQGKDAATAAHCMAQNAKDPRQKEQFKQYAQPAQDRAYCEAKKKEFCTNLQTPNGFALATKVEGVRGKDEQTSGGTYTPAPLGQRVPASSAFCGVKNETIAAGMCTKALDGPSWKFLRNCPAEAKSAAPKLCPQAVQKEEYEYLGEFCPADAKPLWTKYCAGRDYTSMYEKKDKKKLAMCTDLGIAMGADEPKTKAGAIPTSTTQAVDAAKQGAAQTINKIKGLFGK
jgi:hypothetical protein